MITSKLVWFMACLCCINLANGQSVGNTTTNELLDPVFFDALLGNYQSPAKEIITVGRSQKKLFVYFENTRQYRGLTKINDTIWTSGSTVISNEVTDTFIFRGNALVILKKDKSIIRARKIKLYGTEKIIFKNLANLTLGGTVFLPLKPTGQALVLVHGSGSQDRNGNNACMRILADALARKGITVLAYDKQGVGSSAGHWETLNFTDLAQDALSGIAYLKSRHDLNLTKIGLGGYSQAGWIIARAIEQSETVDFAVAINAAGSGITVADQNIYDVKTQLACENKFTTLQKERITAQQRYFFDYLLHRQRGKELDSLTVILKKDAPLKEWLYPNTSETNFADKSQWYNALEAGFDPLPIWQQYPKPTLMIVSEFDDSTPATVVATEVKKLHNKNITLKFMRGCQHLGLQTTSVCHAKIDLLQVVALGFFDGITEWVGKR